MVAYSSLHSDSRLRRVSAAVIDGACRDKARARICFSGRGFSGCAVGLDVSQGMDDSAVLMPLERHGDEPGGWLGLARRTLRIPQQIRRGDERGYVPASCPRLPCGGAEDWATPRGVGGAAAVVGRQRFGQTADDDSLTTNDDTFCRAGPQTPAQVLSGAGDPRGRGRRVSAGVVYSGRPLSAYIASSRRLGRPPQLANQVSKTWPIPPPR